LKEINSEATLQQVICRQNVLFKYRYNYGYDLIDINSWAQFQ